MSVSARSSPGLAMSLYALRNSVHVANVAKIVKDLKDSDSCSVTLVCSEDKVVTVNKTFVEAFCRNISTVLKSVQNEDAIISVPLQAEVIENVIDLITIGSVSINSIDRISRIKEAAEVCFFNILSRLRGSLWKFILAPV